MPPASKRSPGPFKQKGKSGRKRMNKIKTKFFLNESHNQIGASLFKRKKNETFNERLVIFKI